VREAPPATIGPAAGSRPLACGSCRWTHQALRELLALRAAHRPAYAAWPVDAFRLVTGGVANSAQVHTHLCCSEFGDVVEPIDGRDADVTTVEVARTKMQVLADPGPGRSGPGCTTCTPDRWPTPRCAKHPHHQAIALIGIPSDRCNRRISAQSSKCRKS
jgi:methionine synthase II (cobalamin-independent)